LQQMAEGAGEIRGGKSSRFGVLAFWKSGGADQRGAFIADWADKRVAIEAAEKK